MKVIEAGVPYLRLATAGVADFMYTPAGVADLSVSQQVWGDLK